MFAALYRLCGGYVDVVMTNSSWTAEHIRSLWRLKRDQVEVVFPRGRGSPRGSHSNEQERRENEAGENNSVHRAIPPGKETETSTTPYPEQNPHSGAKLVLIGSVRNSDDATKVYDFRLLANEKKVKDKVEFVCDSS
ncbi:asparagine-linked glycosylation protein [Rhizina undulata]